MSDTRKPTIFESKVADLVEDLRSQNAQLRKEREELVEFLKWIHTRNKVSLGMMKTGTLGSVMMPHQRFAAKDYYTGCCEEQIKKSEALLAKLEGGK